MYTWVRTAGISDGKQRQAIEWALDIAKYVSKTFDVDIIVQTNVTGKINQLHWVVNYESLADLERVRSATLTDVIMQQRLSEAGGLGLFPAESVVDNIYATLP